MKFVSILVGIALLAAAPLADAAPSSISFAGRLSTSAGPVNGSQLITFKVFNVLTGGTAVWNDTISLNADNGLVFATLGTTTNPLDATVFTGAPMFLEITIGSETLTPRLVLNAVPYALSASTADKLGGVIAAANVVQSVVAGTGLTGGGNPNAGAVTLSVDSTRVQSRVTGTCAAGSSIRTIAADGTVTCQPDTNSGGTITGVTAGSGLTGGGATGAVSLSVDTSTIQARVTGSCAGGSSIRVINADGSVTCQADNIGFTTCQQVTGTTAVGCPGGTTLTGGGCVAGSVDGLKSSYPFGNSWQCDGSGGLTAYAVCCH
jgi:hypothetical protein